MPIGAILDISPASCTAPLGISTVDRPADRAASRMALCSEGALGAAAMSFITFRNSSTPSSSSAWANFCWMCVATSLRSCRRRDRAIRRKLDTSGNYVRSTRFSSHVADRADLRTSLCPRDFADGQEVLSGCSERVPATIYGRRARMVREASHNALPPLEADNSAYDPNLNLRLLKNWSLLDMQFEDSS